MTVYIGRRDLLACGIAAAVIPAIAPAVAAPIVSPIAQLAKLATTSVVRIAIEATKSGQRKDTYGSGVVIDSSGIVLTAKHLALDPNDFDYLKMTCSDGPGANTSAAPHADMTVIGRHPTADLATMQILNLPLLSAYSISSLPIDSYSKYENEEIAVIDFELQFPLMITKGVIRAYDPTEQLLIIDAPINPGSSGGAVIPINTAIQPKVIGIVKGAIRQDLDNTPLVGLGFATPADFKEGIQPVTGSHEAETNPKTKHDQKESGYKSGNYDPEMIMIRELVHPSEIEGFQTLERLLSGDVIVKYVVSRGAEQGFKFIGARLDSTDENQFSIERQKATLRDRTVSIDCVVRAQGELGFRLYHDESHLGIQLPLAMTTTQVELS
jgi:hypothetical protein